MENRHALTSLHTHGHHIPIGMQRKRSREQTPRRRQRLRRNQLRLIRIRRTGCQFRQGESRQGIRDDGGGILGIRVLDVTEESGVAVGDDELRGAGFQVGEADFGGGVAGGDDGVEVGAGAVGPDGFADRGEGEAAVVGEVGHVEGEDHGGDFGQEVEVGFAPLVGGARGEVEDAVAGARARGDGDGGAFGDLEGGGVDVVDADEVGAEIGDDQVLLRGVDDDLMRVGSRLLGFRTGLAHGEIEVLRQGEFRCLRVDGISGESVGVMCDGQQLCPVGTIIEGRVDRGCGDDGVGDLFEGASGFLVSDLKGSNRGVDGGGEVLVEAEEIAVLEVDLEPGGAGPAAGGGVKAGEVIGGVGRLGKVEGGNVSIIGRDVEFGGGDGGGGCDQRGECQRGEHDDL